MSALPKNWIASRIGEVADINPRSQKDDLDDDTLASFVPMKCVEAESGRFAPPENKRVGEVKKGYTPMCDGDVIFAKVTPCMENGKAAVVRGLTNGIGFGSTEFYSLRPKENMVPEFLFYFIIQQGFRREAERHMTGAVGLRRVPKVFLEDHFIPLPALAEQRRIVARIEELFSRLDAGVAALRHAKAQLQRYRQSVLAAAVTGQLTQAWREQHPDTEPAEKLLERILEQRKEQWNARGKYKDPETETDGPSELPPSWKWVLLGSLTQMINGDRGKNYPHKSEYVSTGVPWINTGHIDPNGTLSDERLYYITREKFDQLNSGKIEPGDLVYCLRGATFGKTAVVGPLKEGAIASSLMIVRPSSLLSQKFLYFYLISNSGRNELFRFDNGSAQPNLSAASVAQYRFPLPPLPEQHQIVAEVEARTTAIDHLEAELTRQITRSNRLRQSTLASAFSGQI